MPFRVTFERLIHDLRHGARVFARNPGLTAIAVISIAFGTGANVAMFSVADTLLLRPPPILRPNEVLTVGSEAQSGTVLRNQESYLNYLDIRERSRVFAGVTAYFYNTVGFTARPSDVPRVVFASFITDNFFSVLGLDLQKGRGFRADEAGAGDPKPVVVLTDTVWRRDFEADPNVIGRSMWIAGQEFTIVGVAPAAFTGLHAFLREALFLPIGIEPRLTDGYRPKFLETRGDRMLTLKARLRSGATIGEARAELSTIGNDLERLYPLDNTRHPLIAQTEFEYRFEARPLDAAVLVILVVLAIAVLCVACANVAGLLASRGPVRAREMALRLAIGANRGRLVRQLVTESLGIAVLGAVGGVLVSQVVIAFLRQIQFASEIIKIPRFELDDRALLFSILIAAVSTFLVGLGPALQTTRVSLVNNLKSDRSTDTRNRLAGRSVLVGTQVALSLVLLTISVFTLQIARREVDAGPGFRTTQMGIADVDPGQARYTKAESAQFFARVLESARALPGVVSASVASAMPMHSFQFTPLLREGEQLGPGETGRPAWVNSVDDRYFETMGIGFLAGRTFSKDDDVTSPAVMIVNETFAKHYFPAGDAVGKRMQVLDQPRRLVEIIGIVRTTRLAFPGESPQEATYFSYLQRPRGHMTLLAQTAGESAGVLDSLRTIVGNLDKNVPISDVQTIETFYYTVATGLLGVAIKLIGSMGFMGMTLTMIGLYGLVSYAVNRRTREIGIRIAIGATYSTIVRMVLRQGMSPAWAGAAAGLGLSFLTARVLIGSVPFFRYKVDFSTYFIVVPTVLVVTLVAALLPARRAARTNPTLALRSE